MGGVRHSHVVSSRICFLVLHVLQHWSESISAPQVSVWLCWFVLILNAPINIFLSCRDGSSCVEPVLSSG